MSLTETVQKPPRCAKLSPFSPKFHRDRLGKRSLTSRTPSLAPHRACLAEPLLIQADSPDLDVAAEVSGLVQNLRTEALVRRHSELLRLLEEGTASPEQTDEYRAIETTLSLAKSGNPPTEERSEI